MLTQLRAAQLHKQAAGKKQNPQRDVGAFYEGGRFSLASRRKEELEGSLMPTAVIAISVPAVVELMTVLTAVEGKVEAKGCGIPIILRQLWSLEFGDRA